MKQSYTPMNARELKKFNAKMQERIDEYKEIIESVKADPCTTGWREEELIEKYESKIRNCEREINPTYINEFMYSDRHAYEVLFRISDTMLAIRQLDAERTDDNGMSDAQSYDFKSNEKNPVLAVRRHKDGAYYFPNGCDPFILADDPYEYYDYSF